MSTFGQLLKKFFGQNIEQLTASVLGFKLHHLMGLESSNFSSHVEKNRGRLLWGARFWPKWLDYIVHHGGFHTNNFMLMWIFMQKNACSQILNVSQVY